mmetsp:Transcript_8998/g.10807  ORF Transcript_8998/g.10807 Transcript_8998/m.10807 type:complete len:119 (+) Transcript_8998:9424-9780(+)
MQAIRSELRANHYDIKSLNYENISQSILIEFGLLEPLPPSPVKMRQYSTEVSTKRSPKQSKVEESLVRKESHLLDQKEFVMMMCDYISEPLGKDLYVLNLVSRNYRCWVVEIYRKIKY